MVTAFQGTVRDGQIQLKTDHPLPEGAQVIVVLVEDMSAEPRWLTARELAHSDIVGLWADREDIGDSAEYARKLRNNAR